MMQNISNLVIFDLAFTGHHSTYIRYLIEYWIEQKKPENLYFVVSPEFIKRYPDILKLAASRKNTNIAIQSIELSEYSRYCAYKASKQFLKRVWYEFNLVYKYTKKLDASHCMLMYFDHFQVPLAFGLKAFCPVSGIYFRPAFHYSHFQEQSFNWKEHLKHYAQKRLLHQALKNSCIQNLFVLDRFSVPYIQQLVANTNIKQLADPVKLGIIDSEKLQEFRDNLGVEGSRKIFLQFGSLNFRKGIYQLLEAIHLLPNEIGNQVCFLLVGKAVESEKSKIEFELGKLSQSSPVQIIRCNEFVSEEEVPYYFNSADYVLAPYQKHVGMSGLVIQAAAAKKPILASNYGLIGQLVIEHQLGLTCNSASPVSISQCVQQALKTPKSSLINFDKMQRFAQQNSSDIFAKQIFDSICI